MTEKDKSPRALVFDSGVGGLTITQALQRQVPHLEIVFVSDNAGFPYGTRSEESLLKRVHCVIDVLIHRFQPDILVIACNSASTVVLPSLREKYQIPIVGVVPAIKPAAALSESGCIALLATPATVSRQYTKDLIAEFAANKNVILFGSTALVELAERKVRGIEIPPALLDEILHPLKANPDIAKLDTLVLACTHFPLLIAELKQSLPQVKYWVDSGEAIGRRVKSLLPESTEESAAPVHQAWLTGPDTQFELLKRYLDAMDCHHLDVVPMESCD